MAARLSSTEKFRRQMALKRPKEEKEKKVNWFFKLIDEMGSGKRPWSDIPDQMKNSMNQWLLMKMISHYEEYLPVLEIASRMSLRDRDFYNLMCNTLRRQKHYFKNTIYKKVEEDKELIDAIMREFPVGIDTAREYAEELEPEELDAIRKRWKDLIESEEDS